MGEQEHISPEQFRRQFPGASRSALEANLSAWVKSGQLVPAAGTKPQLVPAPKAKRIRQDSKPLLNKLEERYAQVLESRGVPYRAQAKRYRLANGIWYKVDFTAIVDGREHAWEVKGPKAFRGGFENLKVAAATFPEITWHLVWEENGQHNNWKEQIVLP